MQLGVAVPAPDELVLINEAHEIHQAQWAQAAAPVTRWRSRQCCEAALTRGAGHQPC